MYVYSVYLLCIYKYTHIQYIFWKYVHVHLHSLFYIIFEYMQYINITYFS